MPAFAEGGVETPEVTVDLAPEPGLDALAHHRPLFARDGQQVLFDLGVERLAEGGIEIGAGPLGMSRRIAIAVFQMPHPQVHSQRLRGLIQHLSGFRRVGDDAAIDAERQGDQGVAEQRAADLAQWQHPLDTAIPLGQEKVARLAKAFLNHPAPAVAMEKGRRWRAQHIGIPSGGVGGDGISDSQAHSDNHREAMLDAPLARLRERGWG